MALRYQGSGSSFPLVGVVVLGGLFWRRLFPQDFECRGRGRVLLGDATVEAIRQINNRISP